MLKTRSATACFHRTAATIPEGDPVSVAIVSSILRLPLPGSVSNSCVLPFEWIFRLQSSVSRRQSPALSPPESPESPGSPGQSHYLNCRAFVDVRETFQSSSRTARGTYLPLPERSRRTAATAQTAGARARKKARWEQFGSRPRQPAFLRLVLFGGGIRLGSFTRQHSGVRQLGHRRQALADGPLGSSQVVGRLQGEPILRRLAQGAPEEQRQFRRHRAPARTAMRRACRSSTVRIRSGPSRHSTICRIHPGLLSRRGRKPVS